MFQVPEIVTCYRLTLDARPATFNKLLRSGYHATANTTAFWRALGFATARNAGLPALGQVRVTVQTQLKGKRCRDVLAEAVCAKAAIDGALVDSGCIPDDDAAHLVCVSFLSPVLGCERDALVLEVEPVAA